MNRLTKVLAQEFQMIRAAVMMPGAGGAVYQGVLPMNRCLTVGDCIASANGMFHALLEADGNLRVYRGADADTQQGVLWESGRPPSNGPFFALVQSDGNFCIYRGADLAHNDGWHWGTQMTADGGQFHAQLGDSGEFRICAGTGAHDAGDIVWRSGATDPVASIDVVLAIDYHLARADMLPAGAADLYRETVHNHSARTQTSTISGSVSVSDSAAWSDALGPDVRACSGFTGPVPVVGGKKLFMSADANHAFVRNGGASAARNWGFNAPAAVPANSAMTCVVAALRTAIVVPYTLTGAFTLVSGAKVGGTLDGIYSGSNCHDLSVSLTIHEPAPAESFTISRQLVPLADQQDGAS